MRRFILSAATLAMVTGGAQADVLYTVCTGDDMLRAFDT